MHSSKKARTIISLCMAIFICSCGSDGHSAPTIVSTTPANGANNIGVSNSITVTFSEPMDSSTINTSTISVNKAGSNIAGTVSYAGNTAIFTPSNPLIFNSAYTVTISGDVKDAGGNKMSADYTLSFTTVSYPSNHPVVWEELSNANVEFMGEVDINLDGISDICVRQNETVTFYDGKDFSQLWQFSNGNDHWLFVRLAETSPGKFTPVDLDGDGQKEIMVSDSYIDTGTGNRSETIYIYDAVTHALKWQTTYTYTPPAGNTGYGSYTEELADFDGDGVYEIIVTRNAYYYISGGIVTNDNWVKVLKGPNHAVTWDSGTLTQGSVSADRSYDFNLDGINDLSISESDFDLGSSITFYNGTDFSQLWNFSSASLSPSIEAAETGIGKYTPVDLDGDGQKEFLVVDKAYDGNGSYTGTLYIYDASSYALKWQNSYTYNLPAGTGGRAKYIATVSDIDGDGVYEIILTQYADYSTLGSTTFYDNWVKVLKGPDHAVVWDSGPLTEEIENLRRENRVGFADIDLDGINDFSIVKRGANPSITYYKGTDFSQIWQFSSSAGHSIYEILAHTSVGKFTPVDLDGDGQKEILILDAFNIYEWKNTGSGDASATLYIFDALTHALKWQTTYTYAIPTGNVGSARYYATLTDIDGDGVYEIMLFQDAQYKPSGSNDYTYDKWVKVLK